MADDRRGVNAVAAPGVLSDIQSLKNGIVGMTRRSLLRRGVIGALMGVALFAGAPDFAHAQSKTSINIALTQEPPGLDPTLRTAAVINFVSMMNIFEGLTKLNEDGTFAPNLASSWEISPDGKTYTFHLLPDVKFSDGSPLTSADVKWTFERNAKPESQNNSKEYFVNMASIETPDPLTVVVQLKAPSSMLLSRLAWGGASIVSAKTAETNTTNPVGTGPFMLANWVKGGRIALKRNPLYRSPEKVKLESVTFTVIQDPSAQVAAIQAGDVDLIPQFAAPESVGMLEANPGLEVYKGAAEALAVLGFNNERPPFNDKRVRRAVYQAIDRDQAMQAGHFGYAVPIGSMFSTKHPAYVDFTQEAPYDPEAAKKLLAEAGFPNGFSVTVRLPDLVWTHRVAEVVQADLRKVGIQMSIEKFQWAQFLETVFRGEDYDMTIISHVDPLSMSNFARDYYYNYDNAEFSEIWKKIEQATTEADQMAAFRDAQKKLAEDIPVAFLYQPLNLVVAKKGLHGIWKDMPHFIADMTDVYWE